MLGDCSGLPIMCESFENTPSFPVKVFLAASKRSLKAAEPQRLCMAQGEADMAMC